MLGQIISSQFRESRVVSLKNEKVIIIVFPT